MVIYSKILNMKVIEDHGLIFSSTGQIRGMNYELGVEDLIETDINILKIASITEKLEISLKTDHPLKMIFNFAEGGELFYFLAPRVEDGEFGEDDDDMDEF